ncbi:MAG: (Fe-S)-binding protein [Deltaproteobacteria bacterium]|nr:(Fe-S)-binding protein [Deltaproteobacteria bacterium]
MTEQTLTPPAITKALENCTYCPKLCHYACPVAAVEGNETVTPWGLMSVMNLTRKGEIPFDQKTAALAYQCTHCGACTEACALGNPVPAALNHFRERAFAAGIVPAGAKETSLHFRKRSNPYGIDLLTKLQRTFGQEEMAEKGDPVVYFPGCTETEFFPENIKSFLNVVGRLNHFPVPLYPGEIQCCGYPLYAAGDRDGFREIAEIMSHALAEYDTIVTADPVCFTTLTTLYREAGFPIKKKILHRSEFLAPLLPEGFSVVEDKKIFLHDGCFLNGKHCCGAGGLFPVTSPKVSRAMAEAILTESAAAGARTLVTDSPTCELQLKGCHSKEIHVKNLIRVIEGNLVQKP